MENVFPKILPDFPQVSGPKIRIKRAQKLPSSAVPARHGPGARLSHAGTAKPWPAARHRLWQTRLSAFTPVQAPLLGLPHQSFLVTNFGLGPILSRSEGCPETCRCTRTWGCTWLGFLGDQTMQISTKEQNTGDRTLSVPHLQSYCPRHVNGSLCHRFSSL